MSVLKLGFSVADVVKKGLTTEEDVKAIKEWLKDKFPQLTDEQIAVFLIACNNCHDLTKNTIDTNIKTKNLSPNLFCDRSLKDEKLLKIASIVNFSVMPERYQDSAVIVTNLKDTNYRNYCQESNYKLFLMVADSIVFDDPPRNIIGIIDVKGFSLMYVTKLRISLTKIYSDYINHGLPLAIKEIHFVNTTNSMSYCFNMIRPFIKSEVLKRVHFHKTCDNEALSEKLSIPKRYLPEDYGGELKSLEFYHDQTIHKVAQMQSYFDMEERQRYPH